MEKTTSAVATQSSTSMSQSSASTANLPQVDGQVRVLNLSEYKQAALSLAEAFQDDEVAVYPINTPDRQGWSTKQKWDLHIHVMECLVRAHIMRGLVTCTGPNYDCIAMWMPPGREFDDFCVQLWSGMLMLRWKFSKEGRIRFYDEFLPLLHDIKREVLGEDDPHAWYLVYLGTKPRSRGKGYAKAAIEYTTKQADAQNRICYLESSNVLNLKLYNRLGFQAIGRKAFLTRATKPVEMEIMVRKPISGQLASKSTCFRKDGESTVGSTL